MTARNRPWLVSLAVHTALGAAVVTLIHVPEAPAAIRMRLSSPGSVQTQRSALAMPSGPAARPVAPGLPLWKEHGASAGEQGATVPVSLDELLGPQADVEVRAPSGWISEGYLPPPLPPPSLAPPQGARWALVIAVPAGGGPGAAQGIDSGHPELDQWLEAYLRSVSFPPGLDGQPYLLRWNLALVSDRPR